MEKPVNSYSTRDIKELIKKEQIFLSLLINNPGIFSKSDEDKLISLLICDITTNQAIKAKKEKQ